MRWSLIQGGWPRSARYVCQRSQLAILTLATGLLSFTLDHFSFTHTHMIPAINLLLPALLHLASATRAARQLRRAGRGAPCLAASIFAAFQRSLSTNNHHIFCHNVCVNIAHDFYATLVYMSKSTLSEADFQKTVIEVAELHQWRIYHVANVKGQLRSKTSEGFPDLVLARYHDVFRSRGRFSNKRPAWCLLN